MTFPNISGWLPVYATRLAAETEREALDLPEGCDLMEIAMPPIPDPFAQSKRIDAATSSPAPSKRRAAA